MNSTTKAVAANKNLLLCFDAFGTLFTPNVPIPTAYARAAARHGIDCGDPENPAEVGMRFKEAFKAESRRNPNYGRATGLGAEKWWGNIIRSTFSSFLKPNQDVPPALITELLRRYSTDEGYRLYSDVKPFFERLHHDTPWPYKKTIVGVITNSDDRVPGILRSLGLRVQTRVDTISPCFYTFFETDDISFVVLSYDVGHEKPHQYIFDAASSLLKETLATSARNRYEGLTEADFDKLHVGDDLQKDYDGARAAGWHAVLLDRSGIMGKAQGLHVARLDMKDKPGNEREVLVAKTLHDLHKWRPSMT